MFQLLLFCTFLILNIYKIEILLNDFFLISMISQCLILDSRLNILFNEYHGIISVVSLALHCFRIVMKVFSPLAQLALLLYFLKSFARRINVITSTKSSF